jgi:hypothetical protein
MKTIGQETVLLEMGRRLNFGVRKLSAGDKIHFWAHLHRRYPLMFPRSDGKGLRVNGAEPEENFLVLLHSPAIREVRTACEADDNDFGRHEMLWQQLRRQVGFAFTHPRPQMDIAGLTLEEWLADSTLDVWWPEERGVVELEISAEQMRRLLEMGR